MLLVKIRVLLMIRFFCVSGRVMWVNICQVLVFSVEVVSVRLVEMFFMVLISDISISGNNNCSRFMKIVILVKSRCCGLLVSLSCNSIVLIVLLCLNSMIQVQVCVMGEIISGRIIMFSISLCQCVCMCMMVCVVGQQSRVEQSVIRVVMCRVCYSICRCSGLVKKLVKWVRFYCSGLLLRLLGLLMWKVFSSKVVIGSRKQIDVKISVGVISISLRCDLEEVSMGC